MRHSEVEDDHSEHASSPHEDHDAAPLPDRAGLPGAHVADEGAVETWHGINTEGFSNTHFVEKKMVRGNQKIEIVQKKIKKKRENLYHAF